MAKVERYDELTIGSLRSNWRKSSDYSNAKDFRYANDIKASENVFNNCLGGHVRHPNQVKHWYVLSVCAGDRTDRTEFTDSIGCADRADAMDTCVTHRPHNPR